jgi:ssDNA-binding Zn-finger/Zn-ribbon topoisomerase 1
LFGNHDYDYDNDKDNGESREKGVMRPWFWSAMTEMTSGRCPNCGSDAYYRYGKAKNGRERRLCLVCNRQYVFNGSMNDHPDRPKCPVCNEPMYVYQLHATFIRYRCRHYPACKNIVKVFKRAGRK